MKLSEDFTTWSKIRDIGRWHVNQFVRQAAACLPSGVRVLDAGAGECAYKKLFAHCRYVGVDLAVGDTSWNYFNLDVITSLSRLPFPDATFDAVLSTQTLEHLDDPLAGMYEMHRILKPGGKLFLTAPMAHMEHQAPYDFFRYTSYGLRSLAQRAGFAPENIAVTPLGGMFTRWAYELPNMLSLFPSANLPPLQKGLVRLLKAGLLVLILPMQLLLLALDFLDRRREYPFGWSMIAIKANEDPR
ncbi:MAG: class I SAM-dependent methyltransferase [Anaerolineae bacterium]|nr:class I SAM-dependent methyltransferase [Candidatus Roseilinea sp.]MDW8451128.1 class I SAM-dependent methyltransferase [Anaerolineae bacterium]